MDMHSGATSQNDSAPRTYAADRKASDKYIPAIKCIVGPLLLTESSLEVDCKQATDLVVLTGENMKIAARVRLDPKYWLSYGWQFTIRSKRESGVQTELEKIMRGWANWMFYGHAGNGYCEIDHWFIIDLAAFRYHVARRKRLFKCGHISNGDGTYFAWYDIKSFPSDPPLLIATSETWENEGSTQYPLALEW